MGKASYTLADYQVEVNIPSVGASPSTVFVPVMYEGIIQETRVVLQGAITNANSILTLSVCPGGISGSAVAVGGTVTIVQNGSAAGLIFFVIHSTPNNVNRGDSIQIVASGGAGGANIAALATIRIRR